MRGPTLVLPSGAMPWGRWAQDTEQDTARKIRAQEQDANSVGSQFRARSDLLSQQIAGAPSVSAIYDRSVPDFSRSIAGGTLYRTYGSSVQAFSPPMPDRSYTASVIVGMGATGSFPFGYSYSELEVNGEMFQFRHENGQTGPFTNPRFSLMGTVDVRPGQQVSTQFGITTTWSGTVNFQDCRIWCIFNGSLQ